MSRPEQNIIDVYHNSPNIESLAKLLIFHLKADYLLIAWHITETTWYIPIEYSRNNQQPEPSNESSKYVLSKPSIEQKERYPRSARQLNFERSTIIYSGYIAPSKTYQFMIEAFLDRVRNKDMHDRINYRTELLLSNICHSVRTPLNAILNISDMLNHDPTLLEENLSYLHESSVKLANNIFDIIDMTQLQLGKLSINKEIFNFRELIQDVISLAKEINNNPKTTIDYFVQPEVPLFAYNDRRRIKQILVNLLENAIKNTNKGEIKLYVDSNISGNIDTDLHNKCDETNTTHIQHIPTTVSTHDIPTTVSTRIESIVKHRVNITISDTGSGMDEETQNNIFKPTEVISNSKQYGIGLRISHLMAKKLGGDLRLIKSDPNNGAVFCLELFMTEEKPPEYLNKTLELLSGKHVLVIDGTDDKIVLCKLMDKYQMIYTIASTFEEVLLLHTKKQFDLLVCKVESNKTLELINELKSVFSNSLFMGMINPNLSSKKKIFDETLIVPADEEMFRSKLHKLFTRDRSATITDNIMILIVEDELINRMILEKLLRNKGYTHIDMASDGKEALQMIKSNPDYYNVVLLDIRMPHMSGYEVADAIYDLNPENHPVMIGVTAQLVLDEESLKPYFNQFIDKPIDITLLDKKIKQMINS